MFERFASSKKLRRNFGKIKQIVEIPNLIGMQHESYQRFLQMNIHPSEREDIGLQAVFKSVFPIRDFTGSASLEFVSYGFGEVKHNEEECIYRGMTYEIPIRITARLVVYDVDRESGISNIRDIKEQEIYFGAIPLMTPRGTFIVNGTERVVVSQLHRSSGVFFDHDKGKTHSSGKIVYNSRIIPVRGSWIDMEIDPGKDVVFIRIDRRKKFPVTILFKAFGYSVEDILDYFYDRRTVIINKEGFYIDYDPVFFKGKLSYKDVVDLNSGEILVKAGKIFTHKSIKLLNKINYEYIPVGTEEILDKVFANSLYHPETGDLIVNANDIINEVTLEKLIALGINYFSILDINESINSDSIRKTLLVDKVESTEEALIEIYRLLRPGNPATPEITQDFLDNLFFSPIYYDLSGVGRLKINLRLGIETSVDIATLRKEDILLTAKTLIILRDTQGLVDDIDHLGNRRVRAVGELLENQYRIGLVRMERAIKERMSLQEIDALMPNDLINSKPVSAIVKEFFGTSQLSQFMDKTNPLAETTHKRRLSALGPGGLTRERAGFEVRDVHPSHYGRICPIETPEGPNIGLIVSLSTYARVNKFGFIETPYRVVKDGIVTNKIKFLSAFEEKDYPIAQVSESIDEITGGYVEKIVKSRVSGEFVMADRETINLMDVSSNQLVSVSAALIPFLENDDANRALMGSNMQRQAVPLVIAESPLVGTGVESIVAKDSGVTVLSDCDGEVIGVDSSRIIIKHNINMELDNKQVSIYNLFKFARSNQNTCFNQKPIVKIGQKVLKGEVIADGPSTDYGELALGKNITVAFMPWRGYNFEDSILVSERLVRDGVYTSIHIEEFELIARDTKLGKEEVTRDIPNVGEEALKNLDESGIIKLGAEVTPGDILVGKITPKGETQLSPEEKLLRAIFGEKAGDVKDSSLRVPPGIDGVVIDAKIFSRRGVRKDLRALSIEDQDIMNLKRDRDDELRIIREILIDKLSFLLKDKKPLKSVKDCKNIIFQKNEFIDVSLLTNISVKKLKNIYFNDVNLSKKVDYFIDIYLERKKVCIKNYEKNVDKFNDGDDLPAGVIKLVKVYVAMKRKLSVGDKMAGRHGNKGVVSRILPIEDMPYFKNGNTVDMVLNPLGVPSRMNVGQILEVHLGRAAVGLGKQINKFIEKGSVVELKKKLLRIFDNKSKFDKMSDSEIFEFASLYKKGVNMATPVFNGANESEIKELLIEAGFSDSGQTTLYDGHTGKPFREKITVGAMYMLKLHHLVDDKIHARSIGPYSLVTQQPLGGKAQFGGQRLGEMEVWAIEAYGAAFALQEFLTVKSDDMAGRTRMYEKIVKGQNVLEPGVPESFKVMTKELQSLGLDVKLLED